jgi:hypothetical protein
MDFGMLRREGEGQGQSPVASKPEALMQHTDRIEPAEPIDRIDPLDPMLRMEPEDPGERDERTDIRITTFWRCYGTSVRLAGLPGHATAAQPGSCGVKRTGRLRIV